MASLLLQARSNKPGASTITLIDPSGIDTGYRLLAGLDWGNAAWEVIYSGPRGSQGARAVGATPQNRVVNVPLRVTGTSKDDLMAKVSTINQLAEELRRFGGTIYWRSKNQSYRQLFDVMAGAVALSDWKPRAEHSNIAEVALAAICAPYALGDPMDILDAFSSDSINSSSPDYTVDAGAAANLAVSGGQLTAVANLTTEDRLVHTSRGYSYGDMQATIKAVPGATITSFKAGVLINRIDALNYLEVYVDDNGTNSRLRLDKVVAGARTNLSTTNLASRVVNGTPFWIRGRIETNTVYLEYFTSQPTPTLSPTQSASYILSAAEAAQFGASALGKGGFSWIPQHAAATLDDLEIRPYVYRNVSGAGGGVDELRLNGSVPGDSAALFELFASAGPGGLVWGLFGWWQRSSTPFNLCWNGDFETGVLNSAPPARGWSNAAVGNITAGCTSVGWIQLGPPTPKYGNGFAELTCPATANSGASFRIFRRFKKGVTYTAECWIQAAAATTLTYVKIGNGAANDTATSGTTALSTAWQRITVTWTPTADRDDAHVSVDISTATATVFHIDGVMVYEGTSAPTTVNQSEGRGGFPALGLIEAENSHAATPTADAAMRSGFKTVISNTVSCQIVIDPTLLVQDDSTQGELAIEVWARLGLGSATTGVLVLSALPLGSAGLPALYSEEYGSGGKTLTLPSAGSVHRLVRCGTVRLPTNAGRYQLKLAKSSGADTIDVDYLLLVPANARALSPSGKANDSSFPAFLPTNDLTKRVRADLSGTVREGPAGAAESATSGLGGSLLEAPPGALDALVKVSTLVPDDPTSNTSDEDNLVSASYHFAFTPRYMLARPF